MKCNDCGIEKPAEEFPRNRNSRTGRGSYCKPCHNARTRASRERMGGARRYHLRYRYGMAPADFESLREAQEGLCAICRKAPATQIDHDHSTGEVRGLLCLRCNAGLGALKDDVRLIYQAIDYLSPIPIEDLCS